MNGNYNAQNNLGVMYLQGHGVDESLVHAFAWYSVAAAQGQRDAKKNVEILSDQLSEEQRTGRYAYCAVQGQRLWFGSAPGSRVLQAANNRGH